MDVDDAYSCQNECTPEGVCTLKEGEEDDSIQMYRASLISRIHFHGSLMDDSPSLEFKSCGL